MLQQLLALILYRKKGFPDIDIYVSILIDYIGEEFLDDLVDRLENILKEDAPFSLSIDIDDEIRKSLIFVNDDFLSDIYEYYDIDDNLKNDLNFVLSNSFQLDEYSLTNESCYKMLASILESRVKASESLVGYGIDGFKYKSNFNDVEVQNYCILNTEKIKGFSVERECGFKNKIKRG